MARKLVMVADDDAVAVAMMSAALRSAGIQVVVAKDAMQAVMGAHRSKPDAILLDVNMPGGTGLDALKKIKASANTNAIPVIVVSGSTDAAIPGRVLELGAEEYMQKPLNPLELQQKICAILDIPVPKVEGTGQ